MKIPIIMISIMLLIFSCSQNQDASKTMNKAEMASIERKILDRSKSVVWALNESNVDTLLRDYWRSDSAKFIINGRSISGFKEIGERFKKSLEFRKDLELTISNEEVMVLSPLSAIHIAEFDQTITNLEDSTSDYSGTWTAVYNKIEGNWKVVIVHESFYPVEQQ